MITSCFIFLWNEKEKDKQNKIFEFLSFFFILIQNDDNILLLILKVNLKK
jgi:hypothetical protein